MTGGAFVRLLPGAFSGEGEQRCGTKYRMMWSRRVLPTKMIASLLRPIWQYVFIRYVSGILKK
jgi:hypothetical protein